jgi:lysozyme
MKLGLAFVGALGCACVSTVSLGGCSSPDSSAPAPNEDCLGTRSDALKTCASGTTLDGIDVSAYQPNVEWPKVKAAGKTFAFVRVSDGIDHPDAQFAQNWPAMKANGIIRGFYQYFRPARDVDAQVNLLVTKVSAAGGLHPGDLPPVLDLESDGGLAPSIVVARAKNWLAKVEAQYGVKPIVYTAAFMSTVIGDNFQGYTLWVANYETTCPTMPSGWNDWHFWQHTDKGTVNGVPGPVDSNKFNGSMTSLQKIVIQDVKPNANEIGATPPPDNFGDYQGATLGSSKDPQAAPFTPCR